MSSKLEALKNAFAQKTSSSNDEMWKKFYPFWKMSEGSTAIFRFLPDLDEENPLGFLVENLVHELHVNGERRTVPCLSMYGESCPICDMSRKYYGEKNDELGKKYYRKLSYIGQGIVVESPIEHDSAQLVKLIDFGPKIFKIIQAAFQSGDLEKEPYSLIGGYNFRIKKTKAGQYADYGTSSFAPKQTDLEEELISRLDLMNLKDYRRKYMSRAELEALLHADLTGASVSATANNTPPTQNNDSTTANTTPAAATPAPAENYEQPTEQAAPTTGGSSLVEQLRQRARAKQTAENA